MSEYVNNELLDAFTYKEAKRRSTQNSLQNGKNLDF